MENLRDKIESLLISWGVKLDHEKAKKLNEEAMKLLPEKKSELNKKIAEHHGIDIMNLINSPNYTTLCDEYRETVAPMFVQKAQDVLGITEIQAWTVLAIAAGLLD